MRSAKSALGFAVVQVALLAAAVPSYAAETICRTENRVENPCFSDAKALGWQTDLQRNAGGTGYLVAKVGGRSYTCIRFRDSQTGHFIEEGCEQSQVNLQEELAYRQLHRK